MHQLHFLLLHSSFCPLANYLVWLIESFPCTGEQALKFQSMNHCKEAILFLYVQVSKGQSPLAGF